MPYYEKKDIMHNLSHIDRILKLADEMCSRYPQADKQTVVCGAYFHGMTGKHDDRIEFFLSSSGLNQRSIRNIITAACESLINQEPVSLEGKVLHDAHLLEGGRTFLITKSLVTGTQRGQSLYETIDFIERNILGRGKVCLQENKKAFAEKQAFAENFILELKAGLL